MVILFATDNRVANYAKKIQNTFLEAGVGKLGLHVVGGFLANTNRNVSLSLDSFLLHILAVFCCCSCVRQM